MSISDWHPASWKTKPLRQWMEYPDPEALEREVAHLASFPPLVTSGEIEELHAQLRAAEEGRYFVLQGGDCSETFEACHSDIITRKVKILLLMSYILIYGLDKRVIRIGRIAGQYAKPRSSNTETRNGITLPSYRGPMINRPDFTLEARTPDPVNLRRAYSCAAMTMNFLRSLIDGGLGDMHHPEYWELDFVNLAEQSREYRQIFQAIESSIRFMEVIAGRIDGQAQTKFFCSHEGLHLPYEMAHTRQVPRRHGYYNLTTHMPWIGDRTRGIDGAHIEYFRGIANPIGMKVGPSMQPDELIELTKILNPNNIKGRLCLIHRFGASKIAECLPPLAEAIRLARRNVLWISDPMHGNTQTTADGIKTRSFDDILSELCQSFIILEQEGTHLGGIHVELTGENVTECMGGARGLTADDLHRDYQSDVDPRLNYEQAMEMALLLATRQASRRR
ncbi:MAG: 3-deoxy-7-phosphoheptulonate synthase class II [Planctomycetia bacterium]|nr:3-deoxy-7-phosphoheptulonate synthase class II [Planctomycetia bacterium]